jgi:hypothetical protein
MTKPGVPENQGSSVNEPDSRSSSSDVDHTRKKNRISGAVGVGSGTVPLEEQKLASALLKALFGDENSGETMVERKTPDFKPDNATD